MFRCISKTGYKPSFWKALQNLSKNLRPNWAGDFQRPTKKYKEMGYAPKPNSWDHGGLFVFTPRQCIAWTQFNENPTKFIFE